MEQLSLFDAPQLLLGDYYRAIDNGRWNEIPEIIRSIERLGVKLLHWEEKSQFWEERLSEMKGMEAKDAVEIARFWERLNPLLQGDDLKTEGAHLEKYWFQRIIQKLDENGNAYLTETLHPAFCRLRLGNYRQAIEMVDQYCAGEKDDSRLRSYQSFCYARLNNYGPATTVFVFAFFYDPFNVLPGYIYNQEVVKLLGGLKAEYPDARLRRAAWPFEAWLDGFIEIPPGKKFANKIQALYRDGLYQKEIKDKAERQVYFNHLLYLCEVERRHSKLDSDEIIQIRSRMKEINPEAFDRYIKRIS